MITIGNFFFKYRNLLFPIFALTIFIPSPPLFGKSIFGENAYLIAVSLGLAIAFSGQLIRAVTIGLKYIVRGGKNKKVYAQDLVTEGIFNHCRNPLYVGNILMLTGVGLLSNSLYFILFVVPLFCFIYQAIVLAEENYLQNKFGDQYRAYRLRVNRWIPNLKGLSVTFRSMEFNWRRYLLNEYNTIYLLLLSIFIVLMVHYPPLEKLDKTDKLFVIAIVFTICSALYLFIRYLKKSGKLIVKTLF